MSLTIYDMAITEKIRSWVLDADTTVLSPDETSRRFRILADKTHDSPLQLPLITINRNRDVRILVTANRRMSSQGKVFDSDFKVSDHLNAIPISIGNTINIYTWTIYVSDYIFRNFVFNLINYPSFIINIPYNNSNKIYKSFIKVTETITDNSDIPERLVAGQFSRFTISIELTDAYLFSYNHRKVPKVVKVGIGSITKNNLSKYLDSTNSEPSIFIEDNNVESDGCFSISTK